MKSYIICDAHEGAPGQEMLRYTSQLMAVVLAKPELGCILRLGLKVMLYNVRKLKNSAKPVKRLVFKICVTSES